MIDVVPTLELSFETLFKGPLTYSYKFREISQTARKLHGAAKESVNLSWLGEIQTIYSCNFAQAPPVPHRFPMLRSSIILNHKPENNTGHHRIPAEVHMGSIEALECPLRGKCRTNTLKSFSFLAAVGIGSILV